MGFIESGDTITLNAYLTPLGRNRLLSKNIQDKTIVSFSLGDSDTNYNIDNPLPTGNIPDLTGDDTGCVKSIAETDIKHKIKVFIPIFNGELDGITDINIE